MRFKFNDLIRLTQVEKIKIDIDPYIKDKEHYNIIKKKYDLQIDALDDLDSKELADFKDELKMDCILHKFYGNLDKRYTYNFILINKNYNLCSKKDKLKFVNKINDKDIIYNDEYFNNILAKKMDNLKIIQKYGLVLISKNNNEDRIIYYNNYYNLNKLLYVHIKKNIFDINMIILKNIVLYKINKNALSEIFSKYIYLYNHIMKKVDFLVDYLYDYISKINFPNIDVFGTDTQSNNLKTHLVETVINFIKKNKYLNEILFINTINEIEVNNFKDVYFNSKELYKSIIKDYILHKDLINEMYLYIF